MLNVGVAMVGGVLREAGEDGDTDGDAGIDEASARLRKLAGNIESRVLFRAET